MKRILIAALVLFVCADSAVAMENYIYRQKINWVKFMKVPKEIPAADIKHPATTVNADQMEAMLRSIKISKRHLLSKEIDNLDVFNSWEAHKYAPLFVEALAKAQADQVINFAIIHKRPLFLLQNDKLSTGNLWNAADGLHIRFTRLFAKISGDYQSSGEMDKAIRRTKTTRVSLEAGAGQKLSYNGPMEIILEPSYDFISDTKREDQIQLKAEEEELKPADKREKVAEEKPKRRSTAESKTPIKKTEPVSAETGTAAERLKKLEDLKAQKLITEKEYQELRKKVLSEI